MNAYTAVVRRPGLRLLEQASTEQARALFNWTRANAQLAYLAETLGMLCSRVEVVEAEEVCVALPAAHLECGVELAGRVGFGASHWSDPARHVTEELLFSGPDILRMGRVIYVHESAQGSPDPIVLREWALEHGYAVCQVAVEKGVHLRECCAFIPPRWVVLNAGVIDRNSFTDYEILAVPPAESWAADMLVIDRTAILPSRATRTVRYLRHAKVEVMTVDISEFQNLGLGLTRLVSIFPG
jgi:hypothetical protein